MLGAQCILCFLSQPLWRFTGFLEVSLGLIGGGTTWTTTSETKKDHEVLLSGAVFALSGTLAGVLVEVFCPKPNRIKGEHKPVEALGIVCFVLALIGCIIVWSFNKRSNGPYEYYITLTIQGLIASLWALDTLFHNDPILVVAALFMTCYAGCLCFDAGIVVVDTNNDDLETTQAGLVVLAVALFFLTLVVGLISKSAQSLHRDETK